MHLIDRRDYILAHKPYDRDRMRRQNTELDPLAFACDNALITQPCRDDRNRAAAICYGAWQTVVEKRPKIILLRGGMCSVGTRERCFIFLRLYNMTCCITSPTTITATPTQKAVPNPNIPI